MMKVKKQKCNQVVFNFFVCYKASVQTLVNIVNLSIKRWVIVSAMIDPHDILQNSQSIFKADWYRRYKQGTSNSQSLTLLGEATPTYLTSNQYSPP